MDKKKYFGVLSSAALGVLLAFGLTINAHAAVKSYVVDDNDQIISFNLSNLLSDYTNNLLGQASPMYDRYLKEASNLVAFEDDKKGFVSYDSVIAAYENALSQNNGSEFNVDNFTENVNSADIKNITANYECNQDGSVVQISAGTMPTAEIEKASTDIVGKTAVVASLPQGVDASKYYVTVNGTKLTYDSTTGKFTGTLDGTYTAADLQSKVTVNSVDINNNTVDPTLIEAQNGLPKVQGIVKTQAEKDLASALITAVDTKINNSSAVIDEASIKLQYNNLSSTEKSDFQNAMLDNFSIGTLMKIRSLL